ncbi:MAG: hypothetical protein D6761_01940, partial [Candidatus Dadabacteria bacterium]
MGCYSTFFCCARSPVHGSGRADPAKEPELTTRTPQVQSAEGKLLVLFQGLGAVATTVIAGVELWRRGRGVPVGSLAELAELRIGKRSEGAFRPVRELVPLAAAQDIVFAAWDIIGDNARVAAEKARVLSPEDMAVVGDFLEGIVPMAGVHDPE